MVLVFLVVLVLVLSACSATGLTKRQRETMDRYVDLTADAIYFSASTVKKSLSSYVVQHGAWPKAEKDRREIFYNLSKNLEQHRIGEQTFLEVDNTEMIVEYSFSGKQVMQFPQMLESWVVIFSNKKDSNLEVVSIFPHWCDTGESSGKSSEGSAKKSSYSVSQIIMLQAKFKKLLQDRLTSYSLSLDENIMGST